MSIAVKGNYQRFTILFSAYHELTYVIKKQATSIIVIPMLYFKENDGISIV
jgi:hypothetical protein